MFEEGWSLQAEAQGRKLADFRSLAVLSDFYFPKII